jgi:hypothetical protein
MDYTSTKIPKDSTSTRATNSETDKPKISRDSTSRRATDSEKDRPNVTVARGTRSNKSKSTSRHVSEEDLPKVPETKTLKDDEKATTESRAPTTAIQPQSSLARTDSRKVSSSDEEEEQSETENQQIKDDFNKILNTPKEKSPLSNIPLSGLPFAPSNRVWSTPFNSQLAPPDNSYTMQTMIELQREGQLMQKVALHNQLEQQKQITEL